MDQAKIQRMLQCMVKLSGKDPVPHKELASLLDVSPRSVYRYIQTFRDAGFQINQEGQAYCFDRDSDFFKSVARQIKFTDDELIILRKAVQGLDDTTVIKSYLINKLNSNYNYTAFDPVLDIHPQLSENIQNIRDAIVYGHQMIFHDYQSGHSNTVTNRLVEPIQFTENLIQVWCYEVATKQNKLFKVARIGKAEMLNTPDQYTSQHGIRDLDIFRMEGTVSKHITLTMSILAANLLREENPRAGHDLKLLDNGTYQLDTRVYSFKGVTRFILGLYDEVYTVSPESLRKHINDIVCKHSKHPKT